MPCKDGQKVRNGELINKLIQWFNRNVCKDCNYYHPKNNTCQYKKCATCERYPYVNWFDRHFCEEQIQKVR